MVGIAANEGYVEVAAPPVKGDVPTNGFGETKEIKLGDTTTPVRALIQLDKRLNEFHNGMAGCVKVPLSQNEFEAYMDLEYNIGIHAFCSSRLVKKLNALDYTGACDEILKWDKFKGKPLRGLTIRRRKEHTQCLG
jgi:lysozyme